MSDEDLRALERRWRTTGSLADWKAWANALARTGETRPSELGHFISRSHWAIKRFEALTAASRRSDSGDGPGPGARLHIYMLHERAEAIKKACNKRLRRCVGHLFDRGWLPPSQPKAFQEIVKTVVDDRDLAERQRIAMRRERAEKSQPS